MLLALQQKGFLSSNISEHQAKMDKKAIFHLDILPVGPNVMKPRKRRRENDVERIKLPKSLEHDEAAGIEPVYRGDVWESLNALFTKMGAEARCDVGGEEDTSRLVIRRRIGIDSGSGQVFEMVFRDTLAPPVALKVMPHTSFTTQARSMNEISRAKQASDLVVEYYKNGGAHGSPYFPMVFSTGSCPAITLDFPRADSEVGMRLYHQVTIYNSARDLVERYVKNDKVWARYLDPVNLKSAGMEDEAIQPFVIYQRLKRDWTKGGDIENSILTDDLTIALEVPIKGEYMATELAWGDLVTFLQYGPKKYLTYEMLDMFFERLLQAICDMQKLLKLVHNDLHWGNVLVQLEKNGDALPLIHDFDYATEFKIEEQFDDMTSLFDGILYSEIDEIIIPTKVRAKMEELLSLHKVGRFVGMQNVVDWWKISTIESFGSFGFSFGG